MAEMSEGSRDLDRPPIAATNPAAIEILPAWAAPGSPQQLTLRTGWRDPAAWGLLLVDVARHAALAYEREGRDPTEVLKRIRQFFHAQWASSTDDPRDLTDA